MYRTNSFSGTLLISSIKQVSSQSCMYKLLCNFASPSYPAKGHKASIWDTYRIKPKLWSQAELTKHLYHAVEYWAVVNGRGTIV